MKPRHRSLPVCVFALAGLLWTPLAQGQKETKAPVYFPIAAGNFWEYDATINDQSLKVLNTIAKLETFDGVSMGRLETSVKDKVVATEHLAHTAKGLFRHRLNGKPLDPPLQIVRYPLDLKEKRKQNLDLGDGKKADVVITLAEDSIEVPAGKYKALRVEMITALEGNVVTVTLWYAQDVGMVKQTQTQPGLNMTFELTKHGKKK